MNKLKIIIERFGPGPEDFRCLYVGETGANADKFMQAPSPNQRAEYRPIPVRKSRPVVEIVPAKITLPEQPSSPGDTTENTLGSLNENKPESPKSKSKKN